MLLVCWGDGGILLYWKLGCFIDIVLLVEWVGFINIYYWIWVVVMGVSCLGVGRYCVVVCYYLGILLVW